MVSVHLVAQLDNGDDETHLAGMVSLDTSTLCGYTWAAGPDPRGRKRLTCKLCRRVLAEMRERVQEHKGVRAK